MGLNLFSRCQLYAECASNKKGKTVYAPAPNPNKLRWDIISIYNPLKHDAHAIMINYKDCTNYEGMKIIVYKGKFDGSITERDPHFSKEIGSPLARFEPTKEGWELATKLVDSL